MRKWAGAICLLMGAALIVSALLLFRSNRAEAEDAGEAAQSVAGQLQELIPEKQEYEQRADTETEPEGEEPTEDPNREMPLLELDGNQYIGYLTFPATEPDLVLPVMADWSYAKLKTAPCRHFGSLYSDDLVIAGHNYDTHFGHLHEMEVGETVYFTDVEGVTVEYRAEKINILQPGQVDEVEGSGYDLVLYTCTYNSASRVTVFLNRADTEE